LFQVGAATVVRRVQRQVFAKLKTPLRKADPRTVAAVWNRIGSLLDRFSHDECATYIRHAGYDPI
jgi:hypothetical protein